VIRVAIVAASPAMRAGLRVVLENDPALTLVGEATPNDPEQMPILDAHIVVAHRDLPDWITITPVLLRGVLLLSDTWEVLEKLQSLTLAWGLLLEDAAADEITAAVQSISQGLIVVHPRFASYFFSSSASLMDGISCQPLEEPLTSREREVLQWLGQGLSNRQIAARLDISEHTVKFHVSAIYAKLGVASRAEAVRVGAQRGLLVL
jgi:DNA-binding NarL/FixJ family response regulator